jgi:hypothetical protein
MVWAVLSPRRHSTVLSRNQSKKPCVPARESGRKHRAWGVSPRLSSIVTQPAKWAKARITSGYQIRNGCRPQPRADIFNAHDPGAHAPGFTLAPASQARSHLFVLIRVIRVCLWPVSPFFPWVIGHLQNRVLCGVVNNLVDITTEWRTGNLMHRE